MSIKIDYVPGTEYEIYQDREKFSFGTDAILLSAFAKASGRVLDMGSGTGIIPIRLANSKYIDKLIGVEVQNDIADLAKESVALNRLNDRIEIYNININELCNQFNRFNFDAVVTNPPYFEDGVMKNINDNKRVSRHEDVDLTEWLKVASDMLKYKGKFYMVHRPNRLVDIFYSMRVNGIEPKRIKYVKHNREGNVKLVLIEGIKNGKPNLIIEEDLILYDDNDRTTEFEKNVSFKIGGNMSGILYICPTPIGNLEDITLRTLRVLREVDIIGAEDTRNSIKLLNYYEIKNKLTSYHKFNYQSKGRQLIDKLMNGEDVAIISDAGMPGISDPGSELIAMAIEEDIKVEVLPGASASITALVLSGLNTERFLFYGFLSSKKSEKKRELNSLKTYRETLIFYESPHRIFETLELMEEELGNRNIAICKELTKLHENVIRGDISTAISELSETLNKGEYVIVLEGASEDELQGEAIDMKSELKELIDKGYSKKEAVKIVVEEYKLPKNKVYKESLEI